MPEQLARAGEQRGVRVRDDPPERLQRLRHHAPVRVCERPLEARAIARGAERLAGHAAPPPVGVARKRRRGAHTRDAVRLSKPDHRLAPQSKHGAP